LEITAPPIARPCSGSDVQKFVGIFSDDLGLRYPETREAKYFSSYQLMLNLKFLFLAFINPLAMIASIITPEAM
jgi:hypothetical protein